MLKRILYGNETPYSPAAEGGLPDRWCFQVVFDYGEHNLEAPTPSEEATCPIETRRSPAGRADCPL